MEYIRVRISILGLLALGFGALFVISQVPNAGAVDSDCSQVNGVQTRGQKNKSKNGLEGESESPLDCENLTERLKAYQQRARANEEAMGEGFFDVEARIFQLHESYKEEQSRESLIPDSELDKMESLALETGELGSIVYEQSSILRCQMDQLIEETQKCLKANGKKNKDDQRTLDLR